MQAPIKVTTYYNSSHTRIELRAAAAGRQDRSVVLCAKIGKCTCTLYEQKNPVCIQILRAYTGIGDAEAQSPGMLRKPGDCLKCAQGQKKFERLATRDTLHGSRPNLRHRDLDGRIVPTPSDVWDKGASTKRYARRSKKMTIICIHRVASGHANFEKVKVDRSDAYLQIQDMHLAHLYRKRQLLLHRRTAVTLNTIRKAHQQARKSYGPAAKI